MQESYDIVQKNDDGQGHGAKVWQIGFFTLNNTAVNIYFMLMLYIAYFMSGVLGLSVAVVSTILAGLVVADGFMDPFVGWLIDRTGGRFGKFRPFMLIGNVLMAFSLALMYFSQSAVAWWRFPLFITAYTIYIVGHTCQFCVTRAAQSVLTNDPKQRPVFSAFDMAMNVLLYVGVTMAVSNVLVPRHGGFYASMFTEFFIFAAVASFICTCLAIAGIWAKDRPAFYGFATGQKAKLRDSFVVLKENRNIQMLIIASSTDKLFSSITQNAVVSVIIFGIIAGDFALSGQTNMIVFMPSMIVSMLVVHLARRKGQKEALLFSTYGGIIFTLLIFLLFLFGDPASLSFVNLSAFAILFLVFLALRGGFMSVNNSILVPMVADCVDHEVARSGRYVPGMIGTLFSFADKVVTSLNTVIVGVLVMFAGYRAEFPTVSTPYSRALFWVGMVCYCFLPVFGWVLNIVCLRYYSLSKKGMADVRESINRILWKEQC